MNPTLRRCLAMTVGAAALAALLLVAGAPGAVLLALAPALVCVGIHLAWGLGDADGEHLYRTARAAADRRDRVDDDPAHGRERTVGEYVTR
jgi:hypothetical protein